MHRRLKVGVGLFALFLVPASTWADGVWRLQQVEEYRAPTYNAPGSRFADADPYCPGHTVEIGPGRESRSFLIKEVIPGDCHNRAGHRAVAEVNHAWSEPPGSLIPGRVVPFILTSKVVTVENLGDGRASAIATAGFLAMDHGDEYPERGSSGVGRDTRVAETSLHGPAGTSMSFSNEQALASDYAIANGLRPFVMPAHPWLGSDRNQGYLRFRVYAWHGSGMFGAVDYIYQWDPSGSSDADAGSDGEESAGIGVIGEWRWTCCGGHHTGAFRIVEQGADGRVFGRFGDSPDDNATPLQGSYANGVLQFTRFLTIDGRPEQQQWRAQIRSTVNGLETVDGTWSGFAAGDDNTDFQARKAR